MHVVLVVYFFPYVIHFSAQSLNFLLTMDAVLETDSRRIDKIVVPFSLILQEYILFDKTASFVDAVGHGI